MRIKGTLVAVLVALLGASAAQAQFQTQFEDRTASNIKDELCSGRSTECERAALTCRATTNSFASLLGLPLDAAIASYRKRFTHCMKGQGFS